MRRVCTIGGLDELGAAGDEMTDDRGFVIPMLEPPKGPAMAIREPEAKPAKSPPPAVPRAEAWRLGDGRYILQRGDTFWGLGITYLGSGPRWREIRDFQSADWKARNPDPNLIREGDILAMPAEAQARARALGVLKSKISKGLVAGVLGVLASGVASYFTSANVGG